MSDGLEKLRVLILDQKARCGELEEALVAERRQIGQLKRQAVRVEQLEDEVAAKRAELDAVNARAARLELEGERSRVLAARQAESAAAYDAVCAALGVKGVAA